MDRIAVISDVHANITALNAILDDIENKGISKIFCLGDSVLKCANPDLVVDKLREVCEIMIIGNSDFAMSKPNIPFGKFWTRDKIGDERADFLFNLPVFHEFYLSGHLIRLFHASPFGLFNVYNPMYSNEETVYSSFELSSPEFLFENTDFIGKSKNDKVPDIVGYGHLHTPLLVRFGNKTLFNPGSVGIPVEMLNTDISDPTNKFSTMASYMILEGDYGSLNLSSISFNLVRVPYDFEKEVEFLKMSDMPDKEIIIRTLRTGISNSHKL